MPDKCAACKSGKKGSTYTGSFHSFPNGDRRKQLREQWIAALPFKEWTPSKSSKLCDLHFSPDDFVEDRRDTNTSRNTEHGELKKKYLREDAIPHVWPDYPAYFSKHSPPRRDESATAEARCKNEASMNQQKLFENLKKDEVVSIEDLRAKIDQKALPEGVFEVLRSDGSLMFVSLDSYPVPTVKFSSVVKSNLSFQLTSDGIVVKPDILSHTHIMASISEIRYASEVTKLLSFLEKYSKKDTTPECYVEMACELLKSSLSNEKEDEKLKKLRFLLEQLELLYKHPNGRRYSAPTTATCMMWYKTSAACYRLILSDNVLTVPAIVHMRRLAGALTDDMDFSESTVAYLKARLSQLNEREKNVSILLDEVKTDQNVAFSGGRFFGFADEGITKGLLGVMLASLGGKYHDMVAMIPVVTLDATTMTKIFDKVLKGVTEIGFSTCAVSVDGHRTNKKFYKDLCKDTVIKLFIINRYKPGDKIFLLFDTPHIFKCIYNIFLIRQVFECLGYKEFEEMRPNFEHIKKLYELEFGKTPKIAYKLNDRTIASTPIERVNVDLPENIFHESTIRGLDTHSSEYPQFRTTANFLRTIRKWWNIVNVNDESTGKRKRDPSRDAITLENFENATYLRNFADWCENWQSACKGGYTDHCLTDDTFFTLIHTSRALADLAEYLLREKKFKYVTLRKAQSDRLEGRFGTDRQTGGGNYFTGARIFLEAEKTIRIKCLIKYCNMSMLEVREVFKASNDSIRRQVKLDVSVLLERIDIRFCLSTTSSHGILYYISGYIARSIRKVEKCGSCHSMLVEDESTLEVRFDSIESDENTVMYKKQFFDMINRGGLCKPSNALYLATVHAQEFYDQVFEKQHQESALIFKFKNPRSVFVEAFCDKLSSCNDTESLATQECQNGHQFVKMIEIASRKIFNIGAHNFVTDENSKIHASRKDKRKPLTEQDKRDKALTKIAKLQSENL